MHCFVPGRVLQIHLHFFHLRKQTTHTLITSFNFDCYVYEGHQNVPESSEFLHPMYGEWRKNQEKMFEVPFQAARKETYSDCVSHRSLSPFSDFLRTYTRVLRNRRHSEYRSKSSDLLGRNFVALACAVELGTVLKINASI